MARLAAARCSQAEPDATAWPSIRSLPLFCNHPSRLICLGLGEKMGRLPASSSPAGPQGGGTLLRRHSAAPHRVNSHPGPAVPSGPATAAAQAAEGRRPRPRVRCVPALAPSASALIGM